MIHKKNIYYNGIPAEYNKSPFTDAFARLAMNAKKQKLPIGESSNGMIDRIYVVTERLSTNIKKTEIYKLCIHYKSENPPYYLAYEDSSFPEDAYESLEVALKAFENVKENYEWIQLRKTETHELIRCWPEEDEFAEPSFSLADLENSEDSEDPI